MSMRDIAVGMPVRSGGGARIGHVERVDDRGIVISGGHLALWDDFIEVRGGEVFVSAHRPELGELVEEAPRR